MIRLWKRKSKNKWQMLKQQCRLTITTLAQLSKTQNVQQCILVLGQPEAGKSTLCNATATQLWSTTPQPEMCFEIYLRHNTLFLHVPKDFFLLGEQQQRAWKFFAGQLKKLRSTYLAITQGIICIDLYDLLTRSKVSNETRLSQIAIALNNIVNTLNTPLEILLFFSKTDLVPGFNEFFAHQNKEFLQQPWGVSLENSQKVEPHFDGLVKTLNQQLLWRLHQTACTENLYLVKAFPLAMENVKHKVIEILPTLFQQWCTNKRILPIGLYFISCRQYQELKERKQHKLFFVQQLIEALCQTRKAQPLPVAEKIARSIFILFSCLALAAFIGLTTQSFSHHIALTLKTQQTLQQGGSFLKKNQPLPSFNEISEELNAIQKNITAIEENQKKLLLGKFIFSRDNNSKKQLENIYEEIVLHQWIPAASQQLKKFIEDNLTKQPEKAYVALKIYLLLNPSITTRVDKNTDINAVRQLATLLDFNIAIPMHLIPNNTPPPPQKMQIDAVKKWRNYFFNLPIDKLAYIIFFSYIDTTNPVNLEKLLEKNQPTLVMDRSFRLIPEIYTREAFSKIYKKDLFHITQEAIHGNNVLGAYHRETITADTLFPQLQEEYIQLYSSTWEEAIKHVALVKEETLAEFIHQLETLTSVNSPILSLLKIVQANTSLNEIEQYSIFLKKFNSTLTPLSTPENSALFHSFILLKAMREQLLKMQHDQDPVAACALLKQEYEATSQNPSNAQQVYFYATQLSEPLQTWLQQLVDAYYAWINQAAGECQ